MELALGAASLTTLPALFAVGLGFGVTAERTAFCTMGAVADVVLFGGWRRVRLWAAAIAAAALVLHLAAVVGWVTPGATLAWRATAPWLAVPGGFVFGVGMVVAGGCVSRAWIRAASGSVKGLSVVVAALAGIAATTPALPLAGADAAPSTSPSSLFGLAVAVGLGVWVLRDARFRRPQGPLATASVLGGLVAVAVIASPPGAADGVRFVVPLALAFDGEVAAASPGVAVIAGAAVGAAASARRGGRWRTERWAGTGDVLGHLGGGLAMGVGGTLAVGCTVGAGLTGAAALAPAAWLALAGMVAGAGLTLKLMLLGGPAGAWRLLRRRSAGGT